MGDFLMRPPLWILPLEFLDDFRIILGVEAICDMRWPVFLWRAVDVFSTGPFFGRGQWVSDLDVV